MQAIIKKTFLWKNIFWAYSDSNFTDEQQQNDFITIYLAIFIVKLLLVSKYGVQL